MKKLALTEKSIQFLNNFSEFIDKIEIKDNKVIIETSKDIIFVNKGNSVTINTGNSVNISKEIHLNPNEIYNTVFKDNEIFLNNIENLKLLDS